jgi:hypothetical protein
MCCGSDSAHQNIIHGTQAQHLQQAGKIGHGSSVLQAGLGHGMAGHGMCDVS